MTMTMPPPVGPPTGRIICGDCLKVLPTLPE